MSYSTNNVQKLKKQVSVLDFGAVGDGLADDTVAIQNAFNTLGPGVRMSLAGLTLKISSKILVSGKSNFTIEGLGATVKASNGLAVVSGNELMSFQNCTDFTLRNFRVDGNRSTRTPAEVAAHNIEFRSCHKFLCENIRSDNAVVDGFIFNTSTNADALTFCTDFTMLQCHADNCYRQGASVINGYDFSFLGGSFTNTNGTSPQAGIDIESNSGAANPGNARANIKGVRIEGNAGFGLILSAVSGGQEYHVHENYFKSNILGAISAAANACDIRNNVCKNHGTGVTQGVITFAANSTTISGIASGNIFSGNTNTTSCIYVHSLTSNVRVVQNTILDHASGNGIVLNGVDPVAEDNLIISCGGVGILPVATDPTIRGNTIKSCVGRGIYSVGSTRPKIINNVIKDITSVSGGYIQSDDANSTVEGNVCISTSAATATRAMQLGPVTHKSVSYNSAVNLHSTDPFFFSGAGKADMFVNNSGGTDNPGGVAKRLSSPSGTTGVRPAAGSVSAGQLYWNTTTLKPNWSDGTTNWYDATGTVV